MKLVCIRCPLGCNLEITTKSGETLVTGNNCPRGAEYAKEEINCPMRMVTALIHTSLGVLPVKTSTTVPKKDIKLVLTEIAKVNIQKGKLGDVVIKNVANTGADVIITGNY